MSGFSDMGYIYDARSTVTTAFMMSATDEVSRSRSAYRGEQYDPDLGLYYLRARYYSPATGRFLSRDPKEPCNCGDVRHSSSLHKYLYAASDPVNRVDPSGRADTAEEVQIGRFTLLASAALTGVGLKLACEFRTDAAGVNAAAQPENLGHLQTLKLLR